MTPLTEAANQAAKRRKTVANTTQQIKNEGWELVDLGKERISLDPEIKKFPSHAELNFLRDSTPYSIFKSFITDEIIDSVLIRAKKEYPNSFSFATSAGNFVERTINKQIIQQYLATRIIIQGWKYQNNNGVRATMKEVKNYLEEKLDTKILGITKMQICHSIFSICKPNEIEKVFSNVLNTVVAPGQVSCADEKLFRYTGQHIYVRKVPQKPAKVGLWFYQTVVMLPGDLPYLVYCRLHDSDKTLQTTVPTTTIIRDWMKLSQKFKNKTVTVMDSYYMTKAGTEVVKEHTGHVIAAVQPKRFLKYYDYLNTKVKQAGQLAVLHNNNTKETMVLYHSPQKEIGKKMVYSNCHKKLSTKQPPFEVPVYDEYGSCFNHCDKYNLAIAGKNFPIRLGGKNTGLNATIMDYLLVTILVNCWHAYLSLKQLTHHDYPFSSFAEELAEGLVQNSI